MRFKFFAGLLVTALMCGLLPSLAGDAGKASKFELQLLWGTDLEKSPDKEHKPVDADVSKFLNTLPLKFKYYFLVNRKTVDILAGETKKEPVSQKCAVEIKNRGDSKFELSLFGKSGEQIAKRPMKISRHEILAPWGGNAPGSNAWLVVVKRME